MYKQGRRVMPSAVSVCFPPRSPQHTSPDFGDIQLLSLWNFFLTDVGLNDDHSVTVPDPAVLLAFVAEANSTVSLCKPNPCLN